MRLSSDDLPMFFAPHHAELAGRLRTAAGALELIEQPGAYASEPERDRAAAAALAEARLFDLVVPAESRIDAGGRAIDTRALCLAREMLGYVSARADSIFAVQGLGTHPIVLAGSHEQRVHLLAFARGAGIAAFALTEPEAGSDVAAIATRAAPTANGYRLDGDKLFISNLGIADHAVVFATTEPELGAKGITAFWVPLETPGVRVIPMHATAPHPIGALELRGTPLPLQTYLTVGTGYGLDPDWRHGMYQGPLKVEYRTWSYKTDADKMWGLIETPTQFTLQGPDGMKKGFGMMEFAFFSHLKKYTGG